MTEESNLAMRATKCANIIMSICDLYNIDLHEATDMFDKSETSDLIEEGIADLQCRSEKYPASLIWEEAGEKRREKLSS